jgi:cob(I)alamin adenosyltransferase
MENFGKIELYTGDGKGKTTAAAGLALRMMGNGYRVLFVQFMKSEPSGEITMLQSCGGEKFRLLRRWDGSFIIVEPNASQIEMCRTLWREFQEALAQNHYDMLVLDEVVVALHYSLIEESELLLFLKEKPADLEVVMTGQGASEKLIEASDLATEMRKIKHYYDEGLMARRGIEY